MKLHIVAFGVAGGALLGSLVFLAALYSWLFGSGQTVGILQWVVPGFDRNLVGAIVGFVSSFVEGFLFASAFAWIYNRALRALGK